MHGNVPTPAPEQSPEVMAALIYALLVQTRADVVEACAHSDAATGSRDRSLTDQWWDGYSAGMRDLLDTSVAPRRSRSPHADRPGLHLVKGGAR